MAGHTRRACESCRLRRVKCNGYPDRCRQCSHLDLKCVYPTKTKNTSRVGIARGSVISRLKDSSAPAQASTTPRRLQPAAEYGYSRVNDKPIRTAGSQDVASTTYPPNTECDSFSADFFRALIDDYRLYVYDVNPIILPSEILQSIDVMHQPGHGVDNALVYAYAAVTLNLTTENWQSDPVHSTRIRQLIGLALKARNAVIADCMSKLPSRIEPLLTARLVMSAIFVEICAMADGKYAEAFLILREAIAMIQLLEVDRLVAEDGSHRYSNGTHLPPTERSRLIRLYWEAFIHERFLMVVAYYPTTLSPLPANISLSGHDPTVSINIHVGWYYLIKLFCVLDHDFVQVWLSYGNSSTSQHVSAAWIKEKMQYLDDAYRIESDIHQTKDMSLPSQDFMSPSESSPTSSRDSFTAGACLTNLQRADIVITRQWLLMLLWQLAISNCVLASETGATQESAMSLQFPARLSKQLRHVVAELGRQSIERHGSGILKKLFEITNALADVILHVPTDLPSEMAQRLDDFIFLFDFLRNSSNLTDVQITMLEEKHTQIMTAS